MSPERAKVATILEKFGGSLATLQLLHSLDHCSCHWPVREGIEGLFFAAECGLAVIGLEMGEERFELVAVALGQEISVVQLAPFAVSLRPRERFHLLQR